MRMWCGLVAVMATVLGFNPGYASAQPAEPTAEVRVRSVNDLMDKFGYVAGLVGQEDLANGVKGLVRQLSTADKGIEGIDPKRPFGAYATLTGDVVNSPVVVMVPIVDKDRFLQMLKDRVDIVPEKADGGTLSVNLPFVNIPVFLRFANDYLYVALKAKDLDEKALISPKGFFAADDGAVASLLVRIDRVPDDVKTLLLGQLELQLNQELKKNGENQNPFEKKLVGLVFDTLAGGAKTVLTDGKQLSAKVFIDPKTDELSAEVVLTAKDGTALTKTFAGLAGKTSLPAGIVAAANPLGQATVKVALADDAKKRVAGLVDDLIEEVLKQAKPNDREAAKRVLTTLAPTLKAGELDAAVSMTGPNAKGHHTLMAALMVKDGKAIEQLAKDFAPFLPADAAELKFDVEKVGEFTLHRAELKQPVEYFTHLFGTKTVWIATSETCVVVSIEPDGTAIRAGLKAKPAPVPVFAGDLSVAKLMPVINPNLKPDELKALLKDAFGDAGPQGKDTLAVRVTGGESLKVQAKLKGKALRLASTMEQFKIK